MDKRRTRCNVSTLVRDALLLLYSIYLVICYNGPARLNLGLPGFIKFVGIIRLWLRSPNANTSFV